MTETTHEIARRCPWCEQPGTFVSKAPVRAPGTPRGTIVETYECKNTRCMNGPRTKPVPMPGERYLVQINPDGTIPPRGSGSQGPKNFDFMASTSEEERQRARDALRMMEERQRRPGGDEVQR